MNARWIILTTAVLVCMPFAVAGDVATTDDLVATRSVLPTGGHGPAALLLFNDPSDPEAAPQLIEGAGWACSHPALDLDGFWNTQCNQTPEFPSTGFGAAGVCSNLVAAGGGTPVTQGTIDVSVGCGNGEATCQAVWFGSGSCTAPLLGSWTLPLKCKAKTQAVIVGAGQVYASCSNGN